MEFDIKAILVKLNTYELGLSELESHEIDKITSGLCSESFLKQIDQSVYWPKWDSLWWHILFLFEIGSLSEVDNDLLIKIIIKANQQMLPIFPLKEEEVDGEVNGCTEVMCFCFLGSLIKVTAKSKIDIFQYIPWAKDWLDKYQLPDGGYNCDEVAHLGSKKSSMLSTAPILEAMLALKQNRPNFVQFDSNLTKGINYFIEHQILLTSSGKSMKGCDWEKIKFPLFYEYDFIRGLELVLDYALATGNIIPKAKITVAVSLLKDRVDEKCLNSQVEWLKMQKTVEFRGGKTIMFENLAIVPEFMTKVSSSVHNQYVYLRIRSVLDKLIEAEGRKLLI